jgi:hypothetical protein
MYTFGETANGVEVFGVWTPNKESMTAWQFIQFYCALLGYVGMSRHLKNTDN